MSCMDFIKFIYVTMVTAFPPIEHMSDLCTRIFIFRTLSFPRVAYLRGTRSLVNTLVTQIKFVFVLSH